MPGTWKRGRSNPLTQSRFRDHFEARQVCFDQYVLAARRAGSREPRIFTFVSRRETRARQACRPSNFTNEI
jgi:hypothetical protein